MAEVGDWSPIDDNNNSAPPVGAPEGMLPSTVNNIIRAMQGSLRRMYGKIVDGTLALPYLPLAGGTVSGNVAINGTGGVSLSGVQLRNISNVLEVTHAAGGGITTRGPGAGFSFGDRDQVTAGWIWYAQSGTAHLWSGADRATVTSAGRLTTSSVSTQQYLISGVTFAQQSGNSHQILDADGQVALALNGAAGGNLNLYRADAHHFQNNAATSVVNFASDGTITAAGLGISGNISVGGSVSAASLISAGGISSTDPYFAFAANTAVIQTSIVCHGTIDAANYTRLGGPMFLMTEAQFDDITARLENLEAQVTQLRELSHV